MYLPHLGLHGLLYGDLYLYLYISNSKKICPLRDDTRKDKHDENHRHILMLIHKHSYESAREVANVSEETEMAFKRGFEFYLHQKLNKNATYEWFFRTAQEYLLITAVKHRITDMPYVGKYSVCSVQIRQSLHKRNLVKRNGNAHETQRRDTTLLLPCELK
jgi:hypothetical protein